jgi:hypothetical protein
MQISSACSQYQLVGVAENITNYRCIENNYLQKAQKAQMYSSGVRIKLMMCFLCLFAANATLQLEHNTPQILTSRKEFEHHYASHPV